MLIDHVVPLEMMAVVLAVVDHVVPLKVMALMLAVVDLVVPLELLAIMYAVGDHVVTEFHTSIQLPSDWDHSDYLVNVADVLLDMRGRSYSAAFF